MIFELQVEQTDISSFSMSKDQRFLQSFFWTKFKSQNGWQSYYFKITAVTKKIRESEKDKEPFIFTCATLVRKFSKIASIAYIPMGPNLYPCLDIHGNSVFPVLTDEEYISLLSEVGEALKSYLPKNILCVRFDIPDEFSDLSERVEYVQNIISKSRRKHINFKKSPVDIQPPDTTVLDLSLTEDMLLKNMKSKWRYNIRLAEKNGVTIRDGSEKDIDIFFKLYEQTSARDGIAIHEKSYFEKLFKIAKSIDTEPSENTKNPQLKLYIADYDGEALASIIVLFTPYETVYLFGASSNEKRNLMPAYALQWKAIQDAKLYGSSYYDFYGIPPTDSESHPMHGLYRFKTGFGGALVHRCGSFDISCSFLYRLYVIAEVLRAFAYKRVKKLFIKK